jgi:hypothetical protein
MTRDHTDNTCMMTAIFVFKTNKAVKVRLSPDADPKDDFWVPLSQVHNILTEDGEETDWNSISPNEVYLWRITGWIACKLFDCDGWEELVELDLSFLDCE